jgi:hypothetical protein
MVEHAVPPPDFDDDEPTGAGVRLPTPGELPSRVFALELAARARKRASQQSHARSDERIASLEAIVRRLGWMVLCGSLGVMTTCVLVGLYVGGQVATLEAALRQVERHEGRIERLETKVMDGAHADARR